MRARPCASVPLARHRTMTMPRGLARVIARRSIGLVLSGGGARAYAHIGVIRALREAGLPFDVIGGTSMGAIVAACVAMGWDDDEIELRIRKAFVESNPLGDYVLPVVALVRGRRVDDRLREAFRRHADRRSDVPFFAVSTDLVSRRIARSSRRLVAQSFACFDLAAGHPAAGGGWRTALLVDGAVLRKFPRRRAEGNASRADHRRRRGAARRHRSGRFPRSAWLFQLGRRARVSGRRRRSHRC